MKSLQNISYKTLFTILFLSLAGIVFFLKIGGKTQKVSAVWWDEMWHYRQAINISSHTTAESNVYIIATVNIGTTTKAQIDDGDFRFTDQNGNLLPYYISANAGTTAPTFHIQFSSFPAGAQTIYAYYGNQSAPNGFSTAGFTTQATNYTVGSLSAEELSPAPIAYWKFDEGVGSTAYDSSGQNNNGTFLSAPVWKNESECVSGKCLSFDNVDDGISINKNFVGLTDYTMSAWINLKGTHKNYTGTIMSSGDWNTSNWVFGINQANTAIDLYGGGNKVYAFQLNKWTQVTVTRSGSQYTFYVDGKSIGGYSGSSSALVSSATNTTIGRETYAGGYFAFNGYIDEPKIYPYARTADQIKQDYNSRGSSSSQGSSVNLGTNKNNNSLSDGLVGYWKMDEPNMGSGTTFTDSSGNGNTGTGVSSVAITAGMFGNGVDVPGSGGIGLGSVIDINDSNSLDVGYSTSMTVSFWVKNDSSVCTAYTKKAGMWEIFRCSSSIGIRYDAASPTDYNSPTTLVNGQWYLITVTRDIQTNKTILYINGQKDFEWNFTLGSPTTTNGIGIGAYYNGQYSMDGKLDEYRIYNRALSPAEVSQLYNYAPGPIAEYKFDEGVGTTSYDTSGNNFNGTITGAT